MEDKFLASQIPSEFPELAEHLGSAGLQGSLTQFGKFPTHTAQEGWAVLTADRCHRCTY